jgi:hypothetical protein
MGHSPSLLSQLSIVEAEIEKIGNRQAPGLDCFYQGIAGICGTTFLAATTV